MTIGQLTIGPLFRALGANETVMVYIRSYMRIWYAGIPFVVIPMVGNNAIRALGDTKTPSMIMMTAAVMNMILDPILIFGLGFVPELGVAGAALATVFARMTTFTVALYVLGFREKVLSFRNMKIMEVLASWKTILFIGVPNAIARMIIPIGAGIVTGLISSLGTEAVAGFGVATRVEFFTMAVIMALSSITPVFVGQNFGAGKMNRIRAGFRTMERFSILFSMGLYAVLFVLARPIAGIFTKSQAVIQVIVFYLRIVPLGYGFQGILLVSNGTLNALQMPVKASLANLSQMLLVYVPLASLAIDCFGVVGIFASLVISHWLVGTVYHFVVKRNIDRVEAGLAVDKQEHDLTHEGEGD
jgi:putative MATE family efflux protein